MANLFNLQRYEFQSGKYVHCETHVWSVPYAIVKAKKNTLESIKWPPKTYFKIVKN